MPEVSSNTPPLSPVSAAGAIAEPSNIRTSNLYRFIYCNFDSADSNEFVTGASWFEQERFLRDYGMELIDCDADIHPNGKVVMYSDDIDNVCYIRTDTDFINIILSKHPESRVTFYQIPNTPLQKVSIQII